MKKPVYQKRNEEMMIEMQIWSDLNAQAEKEIMIEKTKVIQKRKYTKKDPYWIQRKMNSSKYILSSDPKKEQKLYLM